MTMPHRLLAGCSAFLGLAIVWNIASALIASEMPLQDSNPNKAESTKLAIRPVPDDKSVKVVSTKSLFSPERTAPTEIPSANTNDVAEVRQKREIQTKLATAEQALLAYTLVGIVLEENKKIALFVQSGREDTISLSEGDELAGWTIEEVLVKQIRLVIGDEERVMEFPKGSLVNPDGQQDSPQQNPSRRPNQPPQAANPSQNQLVDRRRQ